MDEQVILKIETGLANKSIAELRAEVKTYKAEVEGATIGSDKWQEATVNLAEAQSKLKDATAMENRGVTALNGSYDSLVIEMAKLKKEYHSVATAEERAALAPRIKKLNDALKDMDEDVGQYGRNVGNYTNSIVEAFKKFSKPDGPTSQIIDFGAGLVQIIPTIVNVVRASKAGAEGIKGAIASTGVGAILIAITSTIGALVGAIQKVTDHSEKWKKANDELTDSFEKSNSAFERRLKLEKAQGLSENAALERTNFRIKQQMDELAIRIREMETVRKSGRLKKAEQEEVDRLREEYRKLYEQLKDNETQILINDTNAKKAVATTKEETQAVAEQRAEYAKLADAKAALAEGDVKLNEQRKEQAAFDRETAEWDKQQEAETLAMIEGIQTAEEEAFEAETRRNEARMQQQQTVVSTLRATVAATSSILGSIADILEADGENAEKNAKLIKGLRIASATIDTISGAVTAYAQAQQLGPIAGPIVGAINAAAVTAAGVANIAKIKATDMSGNSSTASLTTAVTTAPTTSLPDIQRTQVVTTASDQTNINESLKAQRVELVYSDVQTAGRRVKVVNDETTF